MTAARPLPATPDAPTRPLVVAWFADARSPYNDFLFEFLATTTDLSVFFVYKPTEVTTHPWELEAPRYRHRYIDDGIRPALAAIASADRIVFAGWHYWKYLALMAVSPRRTAKAFWTDTPDVESKRGLKGRVRDAVSRLIFRRFTQVWSTGRLGVAALTTLGCPPAKTRSLPFFYDLDRFHRVTSAKRDQASAMRHARGARHGDVVFLGAGQLVKKKRFDDVIRALAAVDASNATLWLAGTGSDEQNLKSLADQLGVAHRVHFLGWLQPAEVEIAFLAADVFVHPAARDPFPTVVLDAMTWGKPIIGSEEAGSVADRVVTGRNGFVHRPGDVNAIAQHMRFFAASPEQILIFGAEARKTACEYPVDLGLRLVSQLGVVNGA